MNQNFTKLRSILLILCFSISCLNAQVITQTLTYTGALQTFTVPGCVSTVSITAYGAQGAQGALASSGSVGGNAGLGAMTAGIYTVSSGNVLNVFVGGTSTSSVGGFNGGGNGSAGNAGAGGGASDVRLNGTALSDRVIVAGGGGGGGNGGCYSATLTGGNGGNGGNGNGINGPNSVAGGGGNGGVGTNGGTGGIGCSCCLGANGGNGVAGIGGNGGFGPNVCGDYVSGGGGGGGYIGGGAGGGGSAGTVGCSLNDQGAGAGGAGGSNYFSAVFTNTTISNGVRTGNGLVILTYSINPTPTVTVSDGVICNGNSYTISPSGASSYIYSSGTAVVSPTATTSYTVTGSNNGCLSNPVVMTVSVNAAPTGTAASTSVSCPSGSNGSATVTVGAGLAPYNYMWSSSPTQTTSVATLLAGGNYTCTITDANSCVFMATVTINTPASLVPSVSTTSLACGTTSNGSATVTVGGGTSPYTYTWTPSATTQTTSVVSNLGAGNFTVTVKDANNCVATQTLTIQQPSLSVSTSTLACSTSTNGTATVFINGGTAPYTYTWSSIPTQTTATATNLPLGNYVVTVKDANTCSISTTVAIVGPVLVFSITPVTCNGLSNGSGTITVNGGTSPYTYSLNSVPTQSTSIVTGLAAGNYTSTVIDANSCVIAKVLTITQPATLTAIATATSPVCDGLTNGTAKVTVSGGTLPYTYSWSTSPVQTSSVATTLASGTYTCYIIDANGCASTKTVSAYIAPLSLNIYATPSTTVCANTQVVLQANGAASYTWSNGATANTTTVIPTVPTGTTAYGFNGKSINGCNVVGTTIVATSSVGCVIGVHELEASNFMVYPNPNNGSVVIKMTNSYHVATIEFFDAVGKSVMIYNLLESETRINTSKLESGIYYYVIRDKANVLFRSKMTKQ